MSESVCIGDPVPDVTLDDDEGRAVRLRDLGGLTVVLYFYPRDDTPGCTAQACSLRDSWSEFEARADLRVYGVSPDDAESHRRFRARHGLPFNLLVDDDHRLADAFGIWGEKQFMGRTSMGIVRSTVIVGPDGNVRSIHRNVKPDEHTDLLRREIRSWPARVEAWRPPG